MDLLESFKPFAAAEKLRVSDGQKVFAGPGYLPTPAKEDEERPEVTGSATDKIAMVAGEASKNVEKTSVLAFQICIHVLTSDSAPAEKACSKAKGEG
jgi:hypothetical protein